MALSTIVWVGGVFLGEEGVEEEQTGADDNGGVGDVEVGPVIAEDVDFEEVDDGGEADAVVVVADGAAEDEGQGDVGQCEARAEANERD